jgi:hypothetical protein
MEDQIITSENDPDGKLAKSQETVNGDLIESVFGEWMSRLEWVREHERECYIKPTD